MPSWVLRFEHVGYLCLWGLSCFFGCGGAVGQITEVYTQIFSIPKTADQEAWPKMLQWKLIVGQTNSPFYVQFFWWLRGFWDCQVKGDANPMYSTQWLLCRNDEVKALVNPVDLGWNYQPPVDVFREGHQQSSAKQLGIVLLMTVFRTDKQMYRVRQQAAEEERRIKALSLFGWTVNDLEI